MNHFDVAWQLTFAKSVDSEDDRGAITDQHNRTPYRSSPKSMMDKGAVRYLATPRGLAPPDEVDGLRSNRSVSALRVVGTRIDRIEFEGLRRGRGLPIDRSFILKW